MDKGKIFISYRDSASKWQAYAVYYALRSVFNREVFVDKFTLRSGVWKPTLLKSIETYRHFAVILSEGALAFANGQGQWFRREIRHAQINGRNIVPVLFDDFNLETAGNKQILSKFRLNVLLERQHIRISSNNFETDIIRLDQFLSGKDSIVEKTLSKKSKKVLSNALREEQETISRKNTNQNNLDAEGSYLKEAKRLTDTISETFGRERLIKDINALGKGTTPYIASSTDSFGISLSDVTSLNVGVRPIYDDAGDEAWLGLDIINQESKTIKDCSVELLNIEDDSGRNIKITLPRLLGWSAAHESKDGFLNIGRSSKRKVDVIRTFQSKNKAGLTGVNGRIIAYLTPGKYVCEMQIGGRVGDIDKVPKIIGLEIHYVTGKQIAVGWRSN